jgi:hypothetical protein
MNFLIIIGFTVFLITSPRQVLLVIPNIGEITTALYVYVSVGVFLFGLFPLLVKEFGWED